MSATFDILDGGTGATDFDHRIVELEVEENADLPGAFSHHAAGHAKPSGDYDMCPTRGSPRSPTSR